MRAPTGAGWSSLAARRAHNPKVAGSNPAPATNFPGSPTLLPGNAAAARAASSTGRFGVVQFGPDKIGKLAQSLGISPNELLQKVAAVLPDTIDKMTPDGVVPKTG